MTMMNFNDLDDEKIEDIECAQSALSKFYFSGYVFLHKFVHVKCMSKLYFDVHVLLQKFVHVKCI